MVIEPNLAWARRVERFAECYSPIIGIDRMPERAIQTAMQEEIDHPERAASKRRRQRPAARWP